MTQKHGHSTTATLPANREIVMGEGTNETLDRLVEDNDVPDKESATLVRISSPSRPAGVSVPMERQRPTSQALAADRVLVLERVFDAPRDVVWSVWTDPEHARRWWGPKGFDVVHLEMDIRPGGGWRKCMRSPDGRESWRGGVFREVVRPERLVFTYASDDLDGTLGHETLVTLTLVELEGKTKLTLHQAVFESVAARDAHQGGWASTMGRLGEYLTSVDRK